MNNESIDLYWHAFMATLPLDSPYHYKPYVARRFGDTPEQAEKLGQLIMKGVKTGTCSALWEWEAEGNTIPKPGMITIVLNRKQMPVCVIENIEVFVCRFNAIDEEFAQAEGEGDLSLAYWREAHMRHFSRTLPKIGKDFREDMPLVCERFKVIYK